MLSCRRNAATNALSAILVFLPISMAVRAQSLSVLPVNIFLAPGQSASTLTITNQGNTKTAVQIRAFAWDQQGDSDQLEATEAVLVSPPIAPIEPGASQVVRLILRKPPQGREATYRILVDQIPPPAEPGVVHVVLRLSIPIFAEPATRAVPQVQFHVVRDGGQMVLVANNDGLRHQVIRDIELSTSDGHKLKAVPGVSPYILAGATRHWNIAVEGPLPLPSETLQLTGHSDAGAIEEQVRVISTP
jgi:fimbrial chaperone protein